MPEAHSATQLSLSFAKLVATPTEIAWSQAYNAGNVFICLSLISEGADEDRTLQTIGKELFNVLQSEFFTLQEKNIAGVKGAIQTSVSTLPPEITASVTLAFFKDATLFIFIAGNGKIVMKRKEKIGTLLAKQSPSDGIIASASGYVQNNDTIILETGHFAQGISPKTIQQALDLTLPTDIVEALSPQMHQQDDGAQAAIVITYKGTSSLPPAEISETEEDQMLGTLYPARVHGEEETSMEKKEVEQEAETVIRKKKKIRLPKFHFNLHLGHRRRLFLNIALILILLLAISIYFTIKKYNHDKQQASFQDIYPTAQQYYSEGQGLSSVNASLSQISYHKAENLLKEGQNKFPKGSKYYQQITALLTNVENKLQGAAAGKAIHATQVQPQQYSLLADEQVMNNGLAFGQNATDVYSITNTAIIAISKTDGAKKVIIKNNNDWTVPVAIVPYDGNIYVLDQKKGIEKFVAGTGGFSKTNYFSGTAPDLSQATGMAIDGSIWLLFKDGTIMQYTRGNSNGLQITGLLKPLSHPTKIITDITMTNIYVLDTGNSRIVQFDKTGKYQNAFSSSVISNAKDFTVSEKDKTAQILSQNKVWELHF